MPIQDRARDPGPTGPARFRQHELSLRRQDPDAQRGQYFDQEVIALQRVGGVPAADTPAVNSMAISTVESAAMSSSI